jgi:hypothetical protein
MHSKKANSTNSYIAMDFQEGILKYFRYLVLHTRDGMNPLFLLSKM